jgi:hypothetical protein
LDLPPQDDKEVNAESIHELPLQKLRVKYRHSVAGKEFSLSHLILSL